MVSTGEISLFIVEDNFTYSFVLEQTLKEYGPFKITTFATAEECIGLLDNNPDVVILDYQLGKGMNGLEALKIIHARKPKIPVIILSVQKDIGVEAELLENGAYDYIEKKNHKIAVGKLEKTILKAIGGK